MNQRRTFLQQMAWASLGAWAYGCVPHKTSTPQAKAGEEWTSAQGRIPDYNLGREEALRAAKARFETLRKSTVRIQAPASMAVGEGEWELRFVQHAFDLGFSDPFGEVHTDPTKETEDSLEFQRFFNSITLKCYWDEGWHVPIEPIRGQRNYSRFDFDKAWAQHRGLRMKGHPLVWLVPKALPKWFRALPLAERQTLLIEHVEDLVRRGGPEVSRWDLVNEALWEPTLAHTETRVWPHVESIEAIADYVEPALRAARKINPTAVYSLNDYGLELTYRPEISAEQQRQRMVALAQELARRGAPVDAIGTQDHVAGWTPPAVFQKTLDDLAQGGARLQITEFWARLNQAPQAVQKASPEAQEEALTQYVLDSLWIALGHPQVHHFTFWGDHTFHYRDTGPNKPMLGRRPVWKAMKEWAAVPSVRFAFSAGSSPDLRLMGGTWDLYHAGQKVSRLTVEPGQQNLQLRF